MGVKSALAPFVRQAEIFRLGGYMLTRPQVCWTADIAKVFDNRAPTRRMARYGIDLG
jgi:hypothetical protein